MAESGGPVAADRPGRSTRQSTAYESLPDETLVEVARHALPGDLRAFNELVRRHEQGIATNCRHITGSPEDSKDLTQEVLLKAFYALDRFRGASAFRTWLWRIKINQCLRFLEKSRRVAFVDLDPEDLGHEGAVSPSDDQMELKELVGAALDQLPESLRVPVVLRDLDGLTYDEISTELGIGLSAVKMRIRRGRERLRERIAELAPDLGPRDL